MADYDRFPLESHFKTHTKPVTYLYGKSVAGGRIIKFHEEGYSFESEIQTRPDPYPSKNFPWRWDKAWGPQSQDIKVIQSKLIAVMRNFGRRINCCQFSGLGRKLR